MMSERMNKRPLLQRDPVELANQVKAIDRNLFRYGQALFSTLVIPVIRNVELT
jgi:hypothetical protein